MTNTFGPIAQNFVALATFDEMLRNLTTPANLLREVTPYAGGECRTTAGFAIASVMGCMNELCFEFPLATKADLNRLLDIIERQFDVVDECGPEDAQTALEVLDDALKRARATGYAALDEALAGFPQCEGCFVRWRAARHAQEHAATLSEQ